jgi:hypothetical protein
MTNYDDLLKYEDESVRLDFKGAQYPTKNHSDLLIDLIAFANADFDGDRFIIIGVIRNEKNEKVFKGINREEIIDSAVYQQLVRENVEPDINLEYFHYSYQGNDYAIFRIFDCSDKPYLMKKGYDKLKQGDGWIRKGTHQPRLNRRDLDSISEKKQVIQGFSGEIKCTFENSGTEDTIISPISDFRYPSELAADAIRDIIERKRNPSVTNSSIANSLPLTLPNNLLRLNDPYEIYRKKSIGQLESDLEKVREEYSNDDKYSLFEEYGTQINFSILNLGDRYIEDASIKVVFPSIEALMIADQIYNKPKRTTLEMLQSLDYGIMGGLPGLVYPQVHIFNDRIEVEWYLKNIKHHKPIDGIFDVPLRIAIHKNLEGQTIPITCIIHGKNLPRPIEKELRIHIRS